jgi:hypothetical protein
MAIVPTDMSRCAQSTWFIRVGISFVPFSTRKNRDNVLVGLSLVWLSSCAVRRPERSHVCSVLCPADKFHQTPIDAPGHVVERFLSLFRGPRIAVPSTQWLFAPCHSPNGADAPRCGRTTQKRPRIALKKLSAPQREFCQCLDSKVRSCSCILDLGQQKVWSCCLDRQDAPGCARFLVLWGPTIGTARRRLS